MSAGGARSNRATTSFAEWARNGSGMQGLTGHGKPLAVRGGEDAAPPELSERQEIVIIDERGAGGFEAQ